MVYSLMSPAFVHHRCKLLVMKGSCFEGGKKISMLVGDALDTRLSYEGATPGSVWSTLDWRKSLEKGKRIERELGVDEIWFGHDMAQFEGFRKLPQSSA